MEPSLRDLVPEFQRQSNSARQGAVTKEAKEPGVKSTGLQELTVAGGEQVLTHQELKDIVSRLQEFLEEQGPSQEEELEQLLSGRQVGLVRAAFGSLAACLTRYKGFYQADEGDYTFVYYLGPEYDCPSPRTDSRASLLLLSCEDVPGGQKEQEAQKEQEVQQKEQEVQKQEAQKEQEGQEDGLGEDDIAAVETGGIWSSGRASPCSSSSSHSRRSRHSHCSSCSHSHSRRSHRSSRSRRSSRSSSSSSYATALDEMEEEKEHEEKGKNIWTQTAALYWLFRDMREMRESSTQTDDDYMANVELQIKLKEYAAENSILRAELGLLRGPAQPQQAATGKGNGGRAVGSRKVRQLPVRCNTPQRKRRQAAPRVPPPPPRAEDRATHHDASSELSEEEVRPRRPVVSHGDHIVRRSWEPRERNLRGRKNRYHGFPKVPRLNPESESRNRSRTIGMTPEEVEEFRRTPTLPAAGASAPVDSHRDQRSGQVVNQQGMQQKPREDERGSSEKENAPGASQPPTGRGSKRREGTDRGGRPFRNRQNQPAAAVKESPQEPVAKPPPPAKPDAAKPQPVAPPLKPRRPLPGERPQAAESSLEFYWHMEDSGATSVRVEATKASRPGTSTPTKSKAEAQIDRVVMSVKKRVPDRSETEIRRHVDQVRLTRGGYSRMTLNEIVGEVVEHIRNTSRRDF